MESRQAHASKALNNELTRQHNEKLRSLFMQAPAAIALLEGAQHVYTFANPLYQKIFNRTEEQLIGRTVSQVFPELQGQGIYELFDHVYQTGEPYTASEFPATFYDNGEVKTGYYNFVIQPIKNESGAVNDLMVHVYEVSKQVEAHRRIEESEAKYRSLFNSMDQGFCVIEMLFDEAGKPLDYLFLEVNPVFETQTGLKNAEGKTARQLVPRLEDRWFEIYGRVAISGNPVQFTERSEAMGRWFEVSAFPIGQQKIKKVALLFKDITEETTARRIMQENKRLLQTVFDASPNSLSVFEPVLNEKGEIEDFRFVMANEFTVQTTGRSDLAGKCYAEEFPHVRATGLLENFKKVAITGTPEDFEQWYEGDGLRHWFRFIINKVGKLLVVTTEDITKRKEAEEVLRKSEQYFRQLTDTVPAIIWITRPDGYCTHLNKNWYRYTGQTEGEAEGFGRLKATHPDDAEEASRLFVEAIENQKPYYILYRLRHHSGEYRWAIDSGEPKFREDGTFDGMIGTVIDVHEQKLAEDKIRESEKRFRSMADASPVMIWTLDENGNSTYYNSRAAEFTGHSEDELRAGKSWQVAIHPDDIEFAAGVVRNAVVNRIPYELECRMQNAKGEWRWILSHGIPRFGDNGEYFGFVGSSIDITERKKAEADLAKSESRYRSIFQTAGVSIWEEDFSAVNEAISELKEKGITDFRTYLHQHPEFVEKCMRLVRITDVNDATLEMFEADDKEQILASLSNIFLPDTMPVFIGELLAIAEGQTTYVSECRLKTVKGNSLYVLFSMKLPAPGGSFDRVLFTLLDITERRAAEEKIRENESRFRLLAEAFPHLAWTASPEGRALYFNHRWYEYTGLSEEEALSDDGRKVLHPDDWQKAVELWKTHLENGEPAEIEVRYREGSTGQFRWFLVKAVPVKKEEGQIVMWIGTCTDIHEQKIAMESLEELVVERTKELKRSNEDLQQFAHVASHDLKEPVRKVKTFLSRLEQHLKGNLDETGTKFIERIHSASNRMYTMIDGVLRYSTVNAATDPFQLVNVNELIKNIETDLEVIIQKTGTQIRYSELPVIEGAPVLLYQVFYNLVNNSIKFASAGKPPQINITSSIVVEKGREFARFVFADNGIGFEEKQSSAIFDTFTRLHSKDKYEGTGLGLALCKKIVERHGGAISAKGVPEQGATFTILLPLRQTRPALASDHN